MTTIHWLGAGLSSTYGLEHFVNNDNLSLNIWMRNVEKAPDNWRAAEHVQILTFSDEALERSIAAGDIVISMLPFTLHYQYALMAINNAAHFICTSYLSPEVASLEEKAREAGVLLVAEVGLDPGIDHILTHCLIDQAKMELGDLNNFKISLLSLCGGVPHIANDFFYKFSWSPIGILKALRQPAAWIEAGEERTIANPWLATKELKINNELLEYYPNRDSSKFIDYFGFREDQLESFLRGSIRLSGWRAAWKDVFDSVLSMNDAELIPYSNELTRQYSYQEHDYDRVIMHISLNITDADGREVYSNCAQIDEIGTDAHTAMAKLVCVPIIGMVTALIANRYQPGILRPFAGRKEWLHWEEIFKVHMINYSIRERSHE